MARVASRTRKARPGLEPLEGRRLLDTGLAGLAGGPVGFDSTSTPTSTPASISAETPRPIMLPNPAGDRTSNLDVPAPIAGVGTGSDGPTDADGPASTESRAIQAQDDTPPVVVVADLAAQTGQDAPPPVTNLRYTTPRGVRVAVNLTGPGTLEGSRVREDGALELVYDGTGPTSQIFSHATGVAPLASVRDADVPLDAQAGAGANQLGLAGLRPFNLVEGGTINLVGGVRRLVLNDVNRNAQVFLRELPEVAEQREAAAGRQQTFATDASGGVELVITDGNFFPIFTPQIEAPVEPPPGIRIQVNRINADPIDAGGIGNPQFYGYDPAAGRLVRFDAATGAALQAIDVPSVAETAGVSVVKLGGRSYVLVGQADLVRAYDAIDGRFVGQFTTANLPSIRSIDGIGTTDLRTVLVDSGADGPGAAQAINVDASLANGFAVPTTPPFRPTREFDFLGGATGVPGFDPLAVLGRGFFDAFQPTTEILGVMAINTTGTQLRELNRAAAPGNQVAPPAGTDEALGSVDQLVARVVRVEDGQNVVNLVRRTNLQSAGSIRLDYPNRLAGLSESFRPELRGSAVFDVQGDVQAFLAQDARGLVLNTLGTLHLVGINRARDSFIVGFPLNHVYLGPGSRNVALVTPTERPPGTRPDVTVIPGLQPVGPLFIP